MKPTLVFQAPIATRSGYGDHARDLLHSLYKLDKFDNEIEKLYEKENYSKEEIQEYLNTKMKEI